MYSGTVETPDKKSIRELANNLDAFISGIALPKFQTEGAQKLTLSLVSDIKEAIYKFETDEGKLF